MIAASGRCLSKGIKARVKLMTPCSDPYGPVPIAFRHSVKRRTNRDAGIIKQEINFTVSFEDFIRQGFNRLLVLYIQYVTGNCDVIVVKHSLSFAQGFFVDVTDHDISARLGEEYGEVTSHTGTSAGYQCYFISKTFS